MKDLVGGGDGVEHEQTQRREKEGEGDAEGTSEYWMERGEVMERSRTCAVSVHDGRTAAGRICFAKAGETKTSDLNSRTVIEIFSKWL